MGETWPSGYFHSFIHLPLTLKPAAQDPHARRVRCLAGTLSWWAVSSYQESYTESQWQDRSLMVRWVVGSILHGGPIELFLVPTSASRLAEQNAVICVILSVG